MRLNHKRVVILGGSSGIGFATAEAAARDGAEVVIASSRKARLDRAPAAQCTPQRVVEDLRIERRRCPF